MVEHDARHMPGYDLVESHLTGRAVFTRNDQRLEIYTANRRDLEHVFGVDLIYLNASRQNIVMLQYKMLEPLRKDGETDWIYRPDGKSRTKSGACASLRWVIRPAGMNTGSIRPSSISSSSDATA